MSTITTILNGPVTATGYTGDGSTITGISLNQLSNVQISSPTNSQVLSYNNGSWVNASAGGSGSTLDANGLYAGTRIYGTATTVSSASATIATVNLANTGDATMVTVYALCNTSSNGDLAIFRQTVRIKNQGSTLVGPVTMEQLISRSLSASLTSVSVNAISNTTNWDVVVTGQSGLTCKWYVIIDYVVLSYP